MSGWSGFTPTTRPRWRFNSYIFGSSHRAELYGDGLGTGSPLSGWSSAKGDCKELGEVSMARIIIKCRYTGHYVFTGIDTISLLVELSVVLAAKLFVVVSGWAISHRNVLLGS